MPSIDVPIEFILQKDLPDAHRRESKTSDQAYLTCPFCGGIDKLNVNFRKGFWRCNKCDEHGNATVLHAKLTGLSTKEAYADMLKMWDGLESGAQVNYTAHVEKLPDENPTMWLPLRDCVNQAFLKALKQSTRMNERDFEDLARRGLSKAQILRNGYWSFGGEGFDYEHLQQVFEDTLLRENSCVYEYPGYIPGFYSANGYWRGNDEVKAHRFKIVERSNGGYLIPVRSLKGEISGFQMRHFKDEHTDEKKFAKYTWLSSNQKKTGVGVNKCEQIHHTGFKPAYGEYGERTVQPEKVVYLTEGALKADVAAYLSGKPFIALIGVSNTSQLAGEMEMLKSKVGTETINLCIDMDYQTNKYVKKAVRKMVRIIKDAGLKVRFMQWDAAYKGVDDYLLAKRENGVKKPSLSEK